MSIMTSRTLVLFVLAAVALATALSPLSEPALSPPSIIYLVVDDWGWANWASHRPGGGPGDDEFPTPNLAALAAEGVLLDRMYGHKFCGPSRASIQTGRNPIHVSVLDAGLDLHNPADPVSGFMGIPRNMTGIASKLKEAGYATHAAGKWHCGHATPDHIPHGRGYDSALTYMDAANDYWSQQFSSSCLDASGNPTLTDLWDTSDPAQGQNNSWTCSQATQSGSNCTWEDDKLHARLMDIIAAHDAAQPLFLFWSAHTVHEPYEVPAADLAKFKSIDVEVRRYYAAMISHLDGLLPSVVSALKAKGMWNNTLFVVTSDNGGPLAKTGAPGLQSTSGGNNWPLRGGKIGLMEGGIRLNAFVSGGLIPEPLRGSTHSGWAHLEDWYATFCALAGVNATDARAAAAGLPPIDGLDLSAMLLANASSPRTEIVIGDSDNNDHVGNTVVSGVIAVDGWKLLIAPHIDPAFFQGPIFPNTSTSKQPHLVCGDPDGSGAAKGPGCLFNVLDDPSEVNDMAATMPAKIAELRARIAELQKTVFNPDRGTHDKNMCKVGLETHHGFLGPWLP